jgi:putative protease
VEITGPKTETFEQLISALWNEEGEKTDSAPHPQQIVKIKVTHPVEPFDLIRREKTVEEDT